MKFLHPLAQNPAQTPTQKQLRKPPWLKARLPSAQNYALLNRILGKHNLATVCEQAACPNIGECWDRGTATFMILGTVCTRNCAFCNVSSGKPQSPDPQEPYHLAQCVRELGLRHAVITSVTRDDLPDGGAHAFAAVVANLKGTIPSCTVEVLIPDFQGSTESARMVVSAEPDIIGHNIELVSRLFKAYRHGDYLQSLSLLKSIKMYKPNCITKSGFMLGLGETEHEIMRTLADLKARHVDAVVLGQYLQPSVRSPPVKKYYTPEEFSRFKEHALKMGFIHVVSAPLARSSYYADSFRSPGIS
ncbi:lipoyl synthase [Candidatus Woesearchaeota archaeon CG_4_10_14_0_8_um_filter_47_5]|nr:MAG: lipoyl synthase [Candidatus Woesearchaeota archaeon CG_4_10_14_0_8_um_filter_47_5]